MKKKPRRTDKPRKEPTIINTTGPITIRGVVVYDQDGNAISRVGVDVPDEDDDE